MSKVICTLPNASDLINDIIFAKHELGMISEDLSDEQAETFLSIPGYVREGQSQDDAAEAARLDADLALSARIAEDHDEANRIEAERVKAARAEADRDDAARAEAEREKLRTEATELGIQVNARWGIDRLTAEITKANESAAAAAAAAADAATKPPVTE